MKPLVIAIVLNYKNVSDTLACVQSLQTSSYPLLDVVVVDNGSNDGSEDILKETFKEERISVLQTGKNLGFAGGNNYGFNFVQSNNPKYVLFINNDTLVEPNFLEPLVDALERDEQAAVAGGLISYYPEVDRVWYAGGNFSALRASSFVSNADMSADNLPNAGIQIVTFVSGCMMLLRVDALSRLAPFDDRFFMYVEDTELCLRLGVNGYRLLYVPKSRIYHKIAHRNNAPRPLYYNVRNRLLLASLWLPRRMARVAKIYVILSTLIKMSVWIFINPVLVKAAWWGIKDFYKNDLFEGRGHLLVSK
jgi:GT2 family glycosyltransferase